MSASRGVSTRSDLISAKVVGGCRGVRVEGESSFAGGGGGATLSVAFSPRGPRGSDSRSKSSEFGNDGLAKTGTCGTTTGRYWRGLFCA